MIPEPETAVSSSPEAFGYLTYAWVFLLSMWGGAVQFHSKVSKGITRPFNIAEFLGDIFTSAFIGLLTFYLCKYAKLDDLLTAVFVAISGHMGTRALLIIEHFAEIKAKKVLDLEEISSKTEKDS